MKDEFPATSRGVNVFSEAFETNLSLIQGSYGFYQVFERSAQTIKSPDHQRITCAHEFDCPFQLLTIRSGSAGNVGKDALAA